MVKKLLGAALALLLAGGCGGGSGSGGGSFSLDIKWPVQRTIPELTQSLVVRVTGTGIAQEQTVGRPTNGATTTNVGFSGLPIGQPLVVQCSAYGVAVSGTAPLLGVATAPVTINGVSGTTVNLDLQSTIDLLTFSGSGLSNGTLTLTPNSSSTLTITAYNTSVTIVPIGPGNLSYSTTGSGFSINPDTQGQTVQVVAGPNAASGSLTVTEKESGKTATINISVS